MLVKAVTLFLIFIAVLAMFGRLRLRLPGRDRIATRRCPECGRLRLGKSPCACGRS